MPTSETALALEAIKRSQCLLLLHLAACLSAAVCEVQPLSAS